MWWKIKPDLWDFFSHWVTDSDCAENLLIGERLSSPLSILGKGIRILVRHSIQTWISWMVLIGQARLGSKIQLGFIYRHSVVAGWGLKIAPEDLQQFIWWIIHGVSFDSWCIVSCLPLMTNICTRGDYMVLMWGRNGAGRKLSNSNHPLSYSRFPRIHIFLSYFLSRRWIEYTMQVGGRGMSLIGFYYA